MKSLREETDAQIEKTRQAKPEFMQTIDDIMASAREFEQGGHALPIWARGTRF